MSSSQSDREDIRALLARTRARGVEFLSGLLKLGQLELRRDLRTYLRLAAAAAIFGVLVVAGYTIALVAIVQSLAAWIPVGMSLLGLAAVHLVFGVWGLVVVARRMREVKPLSRTTAEVTQAIEALRGGAEIPPATPELTADESPQPS